MMENMIQELTKGISKKNQGATLIEVMIAGLILVFLAAGFYKAFSGSKKIERQSESYFNAYSVAANILNNFNQFLGTGIRRSPTGTLSTEEDSFETLASSGSAFYPMSSHSISESDTLSNFVANEYVFDHNISPTISYTIQDKTAASSGITLSGPRENDGFRIVTVKVDWEDTGLDNF